MGKYGRQRIGRPGEPSDADRLPLGYVKVKLSLGTDARAGEFRRAKVYAEILMTLTEFRATLAAPEPPAGLSPALAALWRDAKGDWDGAHELAQSDEGGDGDWTHAYLHRKEGDGGNAAYWYRRAGKPFAHMTLDEEWADIAETLLARPA
jgi:hypothetical protein